MSEGGSISRLVNITVKGELYSIMVVSSKNTVEFHLNEIVSFKRDELLTALGVDE